MPTIDLRLREVRSASGVAKFVIHVDEQGRGRLRIFVMDPHSRRLGEMLELGAGGLRELKAALAEVDEAIERVLAHQQARGWLP